MLYGLTQTKDICLPQTDPGQNAGRYTSNLPLTLYPGQQIVLTPKDIAELGRKDMVLLWKVRVSPLFLTFTSPSCYARAFSLSYACVMDINTRHGGPLQ